MDPASLAMLMQMMQSGKSSLGGIFGGLFGDPEKPYQQAINQYEKYGNKGQQVQNPFLNAGSGAIPQFQDWLNGQKDPSEFINNLMDKYQESPWAKYQQAMRAGQNMGSASGLSGSTPLAQFMEQQAQGISSKDMQQWLSNVLGINTNYGAGQQSLMQGGQGAANALTNMYGDLGSRIGEQSYNKEATKQNQQQNLWGGIFNLI